jgi:hypothetical protein
MGQTWRRSFRAGPPDRRSPRPEGIRVHAPRSRRDPVAVAFDEPLDEALLRRLVGVEDETGRPVEGEAEVAPGERQWTFTPRAAWSAAPYVVRVSPALEDRAGNRFDRPFDRDGDTASVAAAELVFGFEVSRPAAP